MNLALSAVTSEGMPIRQAAIQFGVPKSTLGDRSSGFAGEDQWPTNLLEQSRRERIGSVPFTLFGHWFCQVPKAGFSSSATDS